MDYVKCIGQVGVLVVVLGVGVVVIIYVIGFVVLMDLSFLSIDLLVDVCLLLGGFVSLLVVILGVSVLQVGV